MTEDKERKVDSVTEAMPILNLLKKYKSYNIQTKKKGGGIPKRKTKLKISVKPKKIRKWYKPFSVETGFRPTTLSTFSPKRLIPTSETTKLRREFDATAKKDSHIVMKHDHYTKGIELIDDYKNKKDVYESVKKISKSKRTAEHNKIIEDYKNAKAKLTKNGIRKDQVDKVRGIFEAKREMYASKLPETVKTTENLKERTVEHVIGKKEYIKNARPELQQKLSGLVTNDPKKVAKLKVPGLGDIPVNKLKASQFNDENVTKAYLSQFQKVNTSISKINKNLNINSLSPERKRELALELHKITTEGIVDPQQQEKHFLQAVTNIAYKETHYKKLSVASAMTAEKYKAEMPKVEAVDIPEQTIRQKRDALQLRLSQPATQLTDAEKKYIADEITYLNTQVNLTPDFIDTQIKKKKAELEASIDVDTRIQLKKDIEALEMQRVDVVAQKKADDAEAETNIKNAMDALKQTIDKLPPTTETTKQINDLTDKIAAIEERIKIIYEPITESTPTAKYESVKQEVTLLESEKEILKKRLETTQQKEAEEKQKATNYQTTYQALQNLTPEKIDTFTKVLDSKSLTDLQQEKRDAVATMQTITTVTPELVPLFQRKLNIINEKVKKAELIENIGTNETLTPLQREYVKNQITNKTSANNITELKNKIADDKALRIQIAEQALLKQRNEAKQKAIDARAEIYKARKDPKRRKEYKGDAMRTKQYYNAKDKLNEIDSALGKIEQARSKGDINTAVKQLKKYSINASTANQTIGNKVGLFEKNRRIRDALKGVPETEQPKVIEQMIKTYDSNIPNPNVSPKDRAEKALLVSNLYRKKYGITKNPEDFSLSAQFRKYGNNLATSQSSPVATVQKPAVAPVQKPDVAPVQKPDVAPVKPAVASVTPNVVSKETPNVANPVTPNVARQETQKQRKNPFAKVANLLKIRSNRKKNLKLSNNPVQQQQEPEANKKAKFWNVLKTKKKQIIPTEMTPEMMQVQKNVLSKWSILKSSQQNNPKELKNRSAGILKLLDPKSPYTPELKRIIKTTVELQKQKNDIMRRKKFLKNRIDASTDAKYINGLNKELEKINNEEKIMNESIVATNLEFEGIQNLPMPTPISTTFQNVVR